MEGNGRSMRIWLDLILKKNLKRCVDWSKIGKKEYFTAMTQSPTDSTMIKSIIKAALTDKIHDREMFMKGIDYSYYYEETTDTDLPAGRQGTTKWVAYVLLCENNTLYKGHTSDLKRRFQEHLKGMGQNIQKSTSL